MLFLLLSLGILTAATFPIIETEGLNGTFYWTCIPLPAAYTTDVPEAYARIVFEYFFTHGHYGVPKNVEVLDIRFEDSLLILDVSEDILSYEGSAFERALTTQLIKIAAEIPGIERLTLTIEGALQPLVKGTEIFNMSLR